MIKSAVKFVVSLTLLFPVSADELNGSLDIWAVIEIARKQNPKLLAERMTVKRAVGDVVSSRLYPNPVFNNQLVVSPQGDPGTSRFAPQNTQGYFQISQPIPVAGQRTYAIERALKSLEAEQKNVEEFERNVLYITASKWMDVWFTLERLSVIRRTADFSKELLKVNELRMKNQVITQAEYFRTLNLVETYETTLISAEQEYKNERRNLRALLGYEQGDFTIDSKDLPALPDQEINSADLKKKSFDLRPDYQYRISSESVAKANIRLQNARAYPMPEFGFVANPQNGRDFYGTYINIPIPVNNRNQGEILQAKADLERAEHLTDGLKKTIMAEVDNSIESFSTAKINYKRTQKIFETSEKILRTVRYGYVKGGTQIIDYLDAQRNWFDAQNRLLEAKFILQKTYLDVLYSSGKILDWKKQLTADRQ